MVLLQALRYSVREGKGTDKYRRDIQRLLGVNRVMHLKPSENPRRVDLRGVSRIRVYRGLAEIS